MYRLRVLGGFALDGPPGGATALSKRRAEAVLAVLAVSGDLGCTRERLLEARREVRRLERLDADDLIERLLAGPSLFSVHELRISPDFDALRREPRYRALLDRYTSPPSS
jgi:hypothetical protein